MQQLPQNIPVNNALVVLNPLSPQEPATALHIGTLDKDAVSQEKCSPSPWEM